MSGCFSGSNALSLLTRNDSIHSCVCIQVVAGGRYGVVSMMNVSNGQRDAGALEGRRRSLAYGSGIETHMYCWSVQWVVGSTGARKRPLGADVLQAVNALSLMSQVAYLDTYVAGVLHVLPQC